MRFILLTVFSIPFFAHSQHAVYFTGIVGAYEMNDLKEYNKEILNYWNRNIQPEMTLSYPVSIQAEVGYDYKIKEFKLGAIVNYAETKGVLQYADYSGSQSQEFNVNRVLAGIRLSYSLGDHVDLFAKIGYNITKLEISNTLALNGFDSNTASLGFRSSGISIAPGVRWTKNLGRVGVSIEAGYEISKNGDLDFEEYDRSLTNFNGDKLSVDWSGIRLGIGLGYFFGGG